MCICKQVSMEGRQRVGERANKRGEWLGREFLEMTFFFFFFFFCVFFFFFFCLGMISFSCPGRLWSVGGLLFGLWVLELCLFSPKRGRSQRRSQAMASEAQSPPNYTLHFPLTAVVISTSKASCPSTRARSSKMAQEYKK